MADMPIESHPLAPFVPETARILMLGSFPPPRHRWKMDFYYPNFNNDMWRIMGLIYFQDKNYFIDGVNKGFKESAIIDFLYHQGIAISDVAYQVRRLKANASDKFLEVVKTLDLAELLTKMPHCQSIVTTGETATAHFLSVVFENQKVTQPKIGESLQFYYNERKLILHRLPSSSRAYPLALEQKAKFYREVFVR